MNSFGKTAEGHPSPSTKVHHLYPPQTFSLLFSPLLFFISVSGIRLYAHTFDAACHLFFDLGPRLQHCLIETTPHLYTPRPKGAKARTRSISLKQCLHGRAIGLHGLRFSCRLSSRHYAFQHMPPTRPQQTTTSTPYRAHLNLY